MIAGKHLAASDAGRLTDAFVRARLDNGALREEKRTDVRRKTLDPVWGAGAGETFTLTRRPGASEVQLRVFDEDKMRSVHVSTGVVPLHSLPKNGDWSENLVVSLFPDGPSAAAEHAGESKGFLVVRCAASSPVPRKLTAETPTPHTGVDAAAGLPGAALSPAAFSFWPNAPSPPPPPPVGTRTRWRAPRSCTSRCAARATCPRPGRTVRPTSAPPWRSTRSAT